MYSQEYGKVLTASAILQLYLTQKRFTPAELAGDGTGVAKTAGSKNKIQLNSYP